MRLKRLSGITDLISSVDARGNIVNAGLQLKDPFLAIGNVSLSFELDNIAVLELLYYSDPMQTMPSHSAKIALDIKGQQKEQIKGLFKSNFLSPILKGIYPDLTDEDIGDRVQLKGSRPIPKSVFSIGDNPFSSEQLANVWVGFGSVGFDFADGGATVELLIFENELDSSAKISRCVKLRAQPNTVKFLNDQFTPNFIDPIINNIYSELRTQEWREY